jgi:hypothetical protein
MGFIKRDEFDELKTAFEEFKKTHPSNATQAVKKSAAAPKKKPAAKKSAPQKKSAR